MRACEGYAVGGASWAWLAAPGQKKGSARDLLGTFSSSTLFFLFSEEVVGVSEIDVQK